MAGHAGLPVSFIATAEALDSEFAERIARHRAERPEHWETIEEPVELERALARTADGTVVVVDCLTLWVSNLFGRGLEDEDEIVARATRFAASAHERRSRVVVVSNEVGSGIVPADALSRRYRDVLGRVNATFATHADEAYLVVAGRLLALSAAEPPKGPT
jgi:adenosyl cobinamide kinase/adenosyl cobinamide phosphate guanylyltransferase